MKISIITATWNSGSTLRSTMESVLSQTYSNFEHIIIDGGSSDNTMDIVHELEPLYNGRLRYISESDHGIYDAMNKGIRIATGDIIGLLNSDDYYTDSHVLSTIAHEICGMDAVYADIHYVNSANLNKCTRYYSSKLFRRWMMRFGFMPAHPTFYCQREIYNRYGLFDTKFKIAADFEQLLRLIFINRIRTRYIAKDLVTMRTGGASSSGLISHKQIFRDHMAAYKKNGIYSNLFFESTRYIYRIIEILYYKVKGTYSN